MAWKTRYVCSGGPCSGWPIPSSRRWLARGRSLSPNFVRYVKGTQLRHFTLVLGILALLLGIGGMAGFDVPFFPVLLIIVGADILFKTCLPKQQVKPEGTVQKLQDL